VALGVGVGSALLTALALLAWRSAGAALAWAGLAAGAALFALELALLKRHDGGGERQEDSQRAAGATGEGAKVG
jgi:hypothetical protein